MLWVSSRCGELSFDSNGTARRSRAAFTERDRCGTEDVLSVRRFYDVQPTGRAGCVNRVGRCIMLDEILGHASLEQTSTTRQLTTATDKLVIDPR